MSLQDLLVRIQDQPLYVQLSSFSVPPNPVVYEFRFKQVHDTVWDLVMDRKSATEEGATPKNRFRVLEVKDQKVPHGAILGIATHHAGVLETPFAMVWVHRPGASGCWYIEGSASEMKALFTPNNSETIPGWKSLVATRLRVVLKESPPSLVIQSFWPRALGGGLIHETVVAQPIQEDSPWETIV